MTNLTNAIKDICESIITKNQIYKSPTDKLIEGAEKSLVDNVINTFFSDKENNLLITTRRGGAKLERFNEIAPDAYKILDKDRQLIFDTSDIYLALLRDDIKIQQGRWDKNPNPIKDSLSYSTYDTASGIYIKGKNGFVVRDRPHGKGDSHAYLTLATEDELKKVLITLTTLL